MSHDHSWNWLSPRLSTIPLLCAAGCLLTVDAGQAAEGDSRPPNVVLFLVDDMGWTDCGAYGSKYYETPHIDRLASRGMLFTDAYAAHPLCSPTRASILTGKYPARHRVTTAGGHLPPREAGYPDADPDEPIVQPESQTYLDPSEYTLAEALRDAGYATGHFGKWHLGLTEPHWPDKQGYQVAWHGKPDPGPPGPNGYFSPYSFKEGTIQPAEKDGTYIVDHLTDEACRFIEDHRDRPFLLSVWQFGVHGPWDHKEEYTREFAKKTDPTGRHANPVMASMLKSVDESLGRIVAKLEELGLTQNTVILFTSDNGGNVHSNTAEDRKRKARRRQSRSAESYERYAGFLPPTNNAPLREGKSKLYEGGIRVPLIVVWPGQVPRATKSSEIVSSIDLYPTLLELLGIEKKDGAHFDGISFAPVLRDPGAKLNREALFNFFPHGGGGRPPGVTVRKGPWKLIRWFETSRQYPSKYELYDLSQDLGETTNLAEMHPERVEELDGLIDEHLTDTGALVPKPNADFRESNARRKASSSTEDRDE